MNTPNKIKPIETQIRHINKRNMYPCANTVMVNVDGLEIEVGYESEPPEPSTGYKGYFDVLWAEITNLEQLRDTAKNQLIENIVDELDMSVSEYDV